MIIAVQSGLVEVGGDEMGVIDNRIPRFTDTGEFDQGFHRFCWNCTEEVHRPVDCDTRAKWIRKNSDESENMNWILANSKPCPKCKRNIEKNKGCNHMKCGPPCLHQFC
ncbi:hypothetical protein RJ640_020369 [Escallonia rubra]|uniref:RING-type domain-containing protein n=1 Tax=Escallonia rubra TaxID=112253 RepID=A0AA88QPP1_9ASTE|nr:hypothetical protein RJ640_020369 [Escallonia rubra]